MNVGGTGGLSTETGISRWPDGWRESGRSMTGACDGILYSGGRRRHTTNRNYFATHGAGDAAALLDTGQPVNDTGRRFSTVSWSLVGSIIDRLI